ncbi:MAG: MFS transporter [Deltaproteobacteria bacterium]|nr:MFS transporter [Deltaproteobacteria bacterium]
MIFSSLRNRNYALFVSSDFLGSIGQFVREVAVYWYVYEITSSAIVLGVLGLCESVPRLTLALFAGALADRYNRVRILQLIQFLSAIPVFIMSLLYYLGTLEVWHIIVLEVLVSVAKSASPSATQSLIHELVPEKQIMNAVALSSAAFNAARVVGPSLGGTLILWIGVGGCFLLDGIVLLIAGLELLLIRHSGPTLDSANQNFMSEIKAGLHYIRHAPTILAIMGIAYTMTILVGTYQRFLPVFAKHVFQVGPEGLGLLMSAPGVGAMLTLLVLAGRGEKGDTRKLVWVMGILSSATMIFFCMSRNLLIGLIFLALIGASQIGFRTTARVVIQYDVPVELLGRVTSVFGIDRGLQSLGSVLLGALTAAFGAALGLGTAAVVSLLVTLVLYFFLKPPRGAA